MNITAGHTIFDFVLWLTYSCDGGIDDTDIDYGSDELHTRIGSKFLLVTSLVTIFVCEADLYCEPQGKSKGKVKQG